MNAKELMIGDWVYYKNDNKYHQISSVNMQRDGSVLIAIENDLSFDYMFEPISLTPEILEKNGFEKVYDKYKLPNYRIKWNSYTDLYFTVFTGVDGYWNPIGLNVITGGIPATVDYVHQLQNALRLCGIKKEIVV